MTQTKEGKLRVNVVIKLRKDAAIDLERSQLKSRDPCDLSKTAKELGLKLKHMHEKVTDPELATYYFVEVSGSAEAQRVAERLRACREVEAAYH
jgi:hypothetical protein